MSSVRFGIDGAAVEIEVEVDDPVEAERIASLFPTYVVGSKGPSAQQVISVSTDVDGGAIRSGDGVQRVESRSDLLAAIEFETTLSLLASMAGYAQLHAAGAVVDGGAVAALGPSGSGKSNLAMAWHRAGYRLLGDDAVLLGDRGMARCFARLMKLDVASATAFGIDVESTLDFDPTSDDVWYDPSEAAGWATDVAPLRTVAWVRWQAGSGLRVRRLEPPEGLKRMIGGLFDSGLAPAHAMPLLAGVASEAQLLEVDFEDAVEAAAVLASVTSVVADEPA